MTKKDLRLLVELSHTLNMFIHHPGYQTNPFENDVAVAFAHAHLKSDTEAKWLTMLTNRAWMADKHWRFIQKESARVRR